MLTSHEHMTNQQLIHTFQTIASLLEIKGEVIFKILAYRKAAESIDALGRDINDVFQAGDLHTIPGVGKAIAEKIEELLTTGRLDFLERLEAEVPPSLVTLLQVPDLGPKKVALFWKQLGITDLPGLEAAARQGQLRSLPGMGEKSEAKILAGIESLKRRSGRIPIGRAWPAAQELLEFLRGLPGVTAAESAGSLRRMKATIGDLDLVAGASDPAAVMEAFTHHPRVERVLGGGAAKSSVELFGGLRAQLWVQPPERFGTVLQFATGSKDHNVRLRTLAQTLGYSLSEQTLVRQSDGMELFFASEAEVYAALGLPYIPPELREDRGEVEAARAGKLPVLLEMRDLQADLHCHTTWSDGRASIREMALAAKARGLKVLAITDHSNSLGIVQGMDPSDLPRQRAEIDAVQHELGDSIRLLQGVELEIRADGTLDYPDEVLATLDLVIASLHVSLRQPRQQVTERLLNTLHNPNVDLIGHPTGRMLPDREGADLDMEAVFAAAAEHDTAMEINADPSRLDLEDPLARRALDLGIKLSINRDAHVTDNVGRQEFGVAQARRAWATAPDVINTWGEEKLVGWLKGRG